MTYLFVIFIFVHGIWVQGDELEGWASMPYETLLSSPASMQCRGRRRFKKTCYWSTPKLILSILSAKR